MLVSNPDARPLLRIPELDGVRGIAILLVLIWHYFASQITLQPGPLGNFATGLLGLMATGVDLFFVLSGFLIGGILLDNKDTPHYFKAFYARRTTRIFPLYYAWLFLFVALTLGAPTLTVAAPFQKLFENPLPLWSYATYTQNITMAQLKNYGPEWLGITWSLAVEEQFYLTLPLIIRFVSLRRLPHVLITLIVCAPILRALLLFVPPHSTFPGYVLMPAKADELLLGVMCAYAIRQENMMQHLRSHTQTLYRILAVLLVVIGISTCVSSIFGPLVVTVSLDYSLFGLLYSCLILIAITEESGSVTSLTRNSALRNLGVLSYGAYMIHQGINGLIHGFVLQQTPQLQSLPDLVVTLVALCLTLLIAYLSWNLFEKRIVALGHTVAYLDAAKAKA